MPGVREYSPSTRRVLGALAFLGALGALHHRIGSVGRRDDAERHQGEDHSESHLERPAGETKQFTKGKGNTLLSICPRRGKVLLISLSVSPAAHVWLFVS